MKTLKLLALLALFGASSVQAQTVYSIFSPNGGLSGDWQYQYLELSSAYVHGSLAADKGGTGTTSASDHDVMVNNGLGWLVKSLPNCTDTTGNHLNYDRATRNFACGTSAAAQLAGATASLGGGLLAAGGCTTGTANVPGAATSMVAVASPTTFPGNGTTWLARVTATDTVTVYLCAMVLGTPTASTYNVRVIP